MTMLKYLRYFISPFFIVLAIIIFSKGQYYPSVFFIFFSLFLMFGDTFFKKDDTSPKYKFPKILDFSLYLNLPLLFLLVFFSVYILSTNNILSVIEFFKFYFNIDIILIKNSYTFFDKISIIATASLFIGTMGTVPGHELTHRKQNKFDMLIGNWLLALSWDCAFAIEHVYGHHKNVGLLDDPATAKRGENIYLFIIKAIFNEQKDAWKIEFDHLKRRGYSSFSFRNKMVLGYIRSSLVTFGTYIVGGFPGMFLYLLCAFIAKSLLEVINYTEHYGLVREPGKPVLPRHSWNSNNILSSIFLYNVTRHSAHHEKTNLKFYELDAYKEAPSLPYGYLTMLFLAIFFPFIYNRVMTPKLIDWDDNFASDNEKKIVSNHNLKSGIPLLKDRIYE